MCWDQEAKCAQQTDRELRPVIKISFYFPYHNKTPQKTVQGTWQQMLARNLFFLRKSLLCPISMWSVPFLRTGWRRSSSVFFWSHLAQPFIELEVQLFVSSKSFSPIIHCSSKKYLEIQCAEPAGVCSRLYIFYLKSGGVWMSFLLGCFIQKSSSAFWRWSGLLCCLTCFNTSWEISFTNSCSERSHHLYDYPRCNHAQYEEFILQQECQFLI